MITLDGRSDLRIVRCDLLVFMRSNSEFEVGFLSLSLIIAAVADIAGAWTNGVTLDMSGYGTGSFDY